ncbi:helix-turn-helix domain-containing protein [Streptacidiphilus sp. EB129]|uniref:helix-turn-helix domain-containing protein n=1 Tax=Streptacidiphilus sp. EB129 TaxID=3156262 RepID=UPI003514A1BD
MTVASANCAYCGKAFERTNPRGRPRQFCAADCKAAARRTRQKPAPTKIRSGLFADYRHDYMISRLITDITNRFHRLHEGTTSTWANRSAQEHSAALQEIAKLRTDLDDLVLVMVRQARNNGLTWDLVARDLEMSANTARKAFSPERTVRMLARRAQRAPRPAHAPQLPPAGAQLTPAQVHHSPAEPREQLRSALAHLQRSCGKTVRDIAADSGVSPSYVSRLLSGTRLPTWALTEKVCVACDGDPDHLRPLWEAARGVRPRLLSRRAAASELYASVNGLYLAASCPSPATLCSASAPDADADEVAAFLAGERVPDWPVVEHVVQALRGRPEDVRFLWQGTRAPFGADHVPAGLPSPCTGEQS